jgi:hypothetical protein
MPTVPPFNLPLPPGAEILGAMITPAVLISASGTLVMSTSSRLGRIVDRSRVLLTMAEELDAKTPADRATTAEKRNLITQSLQRLVTRIGLLQSALTSLYLAIGLLVSASLTLGIAGALAGAAWLPVGFGMAGAAALLFASSLLVWEVRVAVRGSIAELGYAMKVVGQKGNVQ